MSAGRRLVKGEIMNSWTEFQNLFNTTRKWVGKVESVNSASNKIIVQIPGINENIEVEGPTSEYITGDYVFIENSTIKSKAPVLREVVTESVS